MVEKQLSIQERFDLLDEAYDFFRWMTSVWETAEHLWRCKAASINTIRDCLKIYEDKMSVLEWNDGEIETFLDVAIDENLINKLWEKMDNEDDRDFYEWWFGLAIGILRGDKDTIKWFRELQAKYDEIVEMKLQNRTLKDLLS